MNLEQYISQLIKSHECVIIPGFGGFIGNYESAQINNSKSLIYPPSKQILFNSKLIKNDGLLVGSWMDYKKSTYQLALEEIENHVFNWKSSLNQGERIEFEELGFLYLQNNVVIFEQNREINLLLQAYGLQPVAYDKASAEVMNEFEKIDIFETKSIENSTLKVVQKEVVEIQVEKPIEIKLEKNQKIQEVKKKVSNKSQKETEVISINSTNKKRKVIRWVAAAAILPFLFYSYWIPMKTDFLNTGKIHLSDFNPLNSPAHKSYQSRTNIAQFSEIQNIQSLSELTASIPDDVLIYNLELNEELIIPVKIHETKSANLFNSSASYHVIAGCFSVESNAQNLVNELNQKGFSAGVLDKSKGLYRVSAGACSSKDDAQKLKSNLSSNGFSGWVLKK